MGGEKKRESSIAVMVLNVIVGAPKYYILFAISEYLCPM